MSRNAARKSIGQLSRATDVGVETIRYYERVGLLPAPSRTEGNYRSYTGADESRLRFIRRARDLGFSVKTVRSMLDLADQPNRPCAEVDEMVRTQLAEVERKIADLSSLRRELGSLAAQCSGGRISNCQIIEALSPDGPTKARQKNPMQRA